MTTVVLAASYLSASLLSMLVPIATVIAVLSWGAVLIRRHERRREEVEASHSCSAGRGGGRRVARGAGRPMNWPLRWRSSPRR